jgi:capsule polysaccharide export protein KpsC/LpsZ
LENILVANASIDRPDLAGRHIFALQMRRWKRPMLEAYFPGTRFDYLPLYLSPKAFFRDWKATILATPNSALLVWGRNIPDEVLKFARENSIPVYFMEDGFIRSLAANASHSLSFSLTLDSRTPYFDSRQASDLENILTTYDFVADPALIARARLAMDKLLASGLSKYNAPAAMSASVAEVETRPTTRRILVIGQVEDDASIQLGCDRPVTNNDLVRLAASENPGCEILYKPHPDVLNGVRKRLSDPSEVAHLATIVTDPVPLPQLLDRADHVYTITSLGGFEALMRGKPVTAFGMPFYAGWGLTDDRQANPRRGRKLAIEEVFAAAYLLYPRYFDPVEGLEISFETCFENALQWRKSGMPESRIASAQMPPKPAFALSGPYGLLGWRHLMTPFIARLIATIGSAADVTDYRTNPILFFRELSNPKLRRLGRFLYPHDT